MNQWAIPGFWLDLVWIAWSVSWLGAAWWSSRAAARPRFSQEAPYRYITIIGILLMCGVSPRIHHTGWSAWTDAGWFGFLLLALQLCGVAFAWWARIHLGRLWSARVTSKPDHRVVDTGPYRLVRHPIYTGLLLAVIVTAIAENAWIAYLGAGLIIIATVMKAKLEESFLRQQLGAIAYDGYAARTPMIVPVGWGKDRV